MPKQIIIAEQHRIAAVFSEDQIQELVVATGSHQVSDIYLGVVENVLPGIDAAFVNIGDTERNGFMHVTDLGPLRLKRTAGAITELVAPQQKVLVQVMKEPTGNKGPRLTGNVTLPGRYLVLMPFGKGVHLSRRIVKESERNRLRALAILVKPAGMGLLVRTEAEGMSEDAIIEDLEFLQRRWESIQEEASTTRPPALLNRDDDFIQRVLRDMYTTDVNRIVADSHRGVKRVKQHLINWSGGKSPQGVSIDHHNESQPILDYFRVNAAIREALKPRVDLPSGGYVIIEPTEALTVIDVNSGSFTRSATARETVLWTNCEAATEIARQLRLRNIAGVIIVDFIDMDSRRDQLQVLEQFNKALRQDKARPQIAQLSELGLVELTRKRQGQNIYELFSRPCAACGGLGHVVTLPGDPEFDADAQHAVEVRNMEPKVRLPEPVKENLEEGLELESSSDLQELDLIHHPSYQELGDGGGNRRRRRRRPVPDPDRDRLERSNASDSLYKTPSTETEFPGAVDIDRPRKGSKPVREIGKTESDPPESVVIPMTSEEQDVYALMGISPLVRIDRTLKNPRNAIISIVEPGETPSQVETSNNEPPASESEETVTERIEPVEVLTVVASEESEELPESEAQMALPLEEAPQSESDADETDTEPTLEVASTPTRRRRRRSSASA